MHRLRSHFILSHILPVLVIVPLFGLLILYVVQTQLLIANISNSLTEQAEIIAEVANTQPGLWRDTAVAETYIGRISPRLEVSIMLMDASGVLLATSDPAYTAQYGQPLTYPGLDQALTGERLLAVSGAQIDVTVPAMNTQEQVVGLVRVTNELDRATARFDSLRRFILAMVGLELALGVVMGLLLALNLERPLARVTAAIFAVGQGQASPIPESGPTEVRQLAQAFNSLLGRLETLESSRRRLLANLVHELGRPLGALRSAVYSLRHGGDQDEVLRQELLAGMEAELARMQPMLDDLAQLHEQVLGTLHLNRQETLLVEWLAPVLAPWREAAQAKGLHWQVNVPLTLPLVPLDRARMAQAVGNLLSNAVKYSRPGGRIDVPAGREAGTIWLRVSDTGPGIPAGELAHIFDPFYRGQQETRFPQGLGLGLTIARDLVEAHGGHLEVTSRPGQGSHFTIYLPLAVPTLPAGSAPAA